MKYRTFQRIATALLLLSFFGGCEVTSEKIERWKQSERGAAKIRAAVRDTDQKLPIRIEAAEALTEMGLTVPLQDDFKSLADADRATLIKGLVPRLIEKMKGANPNGTTRIQLQAKDALFSLREALPPDQQAKADQALTSWLLADWGARGEGEHSADKIMREIGAPAGAAIAKVIGEQPELVVTMATLLAEIAKPADRDHAAEALVALAQKQNPVSEKMLHALGKINSSKATTYLVQLTGEGSLEQRTMALRALALAADPQAVEAVRAIAADASLKGDQAILRDEAFSVLEKTKDPKSIEALASFLRGRDERVRYRAVEALLSGFGAKGLSKLLQELPPIYTYKKQDLIDFVEADIVGLGKSALPPLRQALESQSWIARLIAVRMLGKMGAQEDAAALERLVNDKTKLPGWDKGATLGTVARAAVSQLKDTK